MSEHDFVSETGADSLIRRFCGLGPDGFMLPSLPDVCHLLRMTGLRAFGCADNHPEMIA